MVQRTLLYVIGLSPRIADEKLLMQAEYFGQYGQIKNLVVNSSKPFKSSVGTSYSAYINFSSEVEASLCIRACDGFELDRRILKVTFGTTKYCAHFLRGHKCNKADCTYLHELGSLFDTFTREEIQHNKHVQPHNSVFTLLKTVVEVDDKHVFPTASLVRPRYFSEDCFQTPVKKERLASFDNSPAKRHSRYAFVGDSDEDGPELPAFLGSLVASCSPTQAEVEVSTETATQLMKEDWASDILACENKSSGVLIRAGRLSNQH